MFEVVVGDSHWLQALDTDVNVETCLNVIFRNASFLELLSCLSHRKRHCLVLLGEPTTLSSCLFLLVSVFLIVLAKKCGNGLHSLLEMNLSIVSSWDLIFDELWLCPLSEWVVLVGWVFPLELSDIISVFFSWWVLRQRWLEVWSVHPHISNGVHIWAVHQILFLDRSYFRMRVTRSACDAGWIFVERFSHLSDCWLLIVRVLCSHHRWFLLLHEGIITNPSSRMILLAVSHLVLLYRRGSALWKPVLSKQVIP